MSRDSLGLAVVSYHSEPDLKRFLASYRAASPSVPLHMAVVLVDVTDVELQEAQRLVPLYLDGLPSTEAIIATYRSNVGYNRACNDAATWFGERCCSTYAFFNCDTELRVGALEECQHRLWSDSSYGILGPRQVDRQGLITHAGIFGSPPRHRAFKVHGSDAEYTDVRDDCWSVMGSAYFIKHTVWDQLTDCPLYREVAPDAHGAFLETEHFHGEEWLSRHAVAHGYKVVYDGTVTIVHQQGGAMPSHAWAVAQMQKSKPLYEAACVVHGIPSA